MKLCSWNIAGLKDKLEKKEIFDFIQDYDIVWILETKTYFHLSVPGFMVYRNVSPTGMNRGGVVMLVKNRLKDFICNVNMEVDGQIWIVLSFLITVKLGGVYIPPHDSPYYERSQWGAVAAQLAGPADHVIVMGDLNARVGTPVLSDARGHPYRYEGVVDAVVNGHGREALNICKNSQMVVMNHLSRDVNPLGGGLSFRRGGRWLSEIDICMAKHHTAKIISILETRQDIVGSDHAPLCIQVNLEGKITNLDEMVYRASSLGKTIVGNQEPNKLSRSISYKEVSTASFKDTLNQLPPPTVTEASDPSALARDACDAIAAAARRCRAPRPQQQPRWDAEQPRWERLLASKDPRIIWNAINWKGKVKDEGDNTPTDAEFKDYFEKLLHREGNNDLEIDVTESPYIPLLDDQFSAAELDSAVKGLNKNKSYSGLCPGLISVLPATWMIFLLTLFNLVFSSISYPSQWCDSKLFTVFKKGNRMLTNNYRGISILDTFAKIFDVMILNRLKLWGVVDQCQAGATAGRGCIEQIFTLRMAIDTAIKKKKKLFLIFIDFRAAYDTVPRKKLVEALKRRRCDRLMILIITAMYRTTKSVLKSAIISTSIGIRQGAPSSCYLFVLYLDSLVRRLKEAFREDGFLGVLQVLLLMDDTVLLATSRQMAEAKLTVLVTWCQEHGMELNLKKTKLMVVNGDMNDKRPLIVNDIVVKYSSTYLYLGAWMTDSGKMADVMALHDEHCGTKEH